MKSIKLTNTTGREKAIQQGGGLFTTLQGGETKTVKFAEEPSEDMLRKLALSGVTSGDADLDEDEEAAYAKIHQTVNEGGPRITSAVRPPLANVEATTVDEEASKVSERQANARVEALAKTIAANEKQNEAAAPAPWQKGLVTADQAPVVPVTQEPTAPVTPAAAATAQTAPAAAKK